MTEKISNVGATTNAPVQDNPPSKMKAQPRINVREGMRLADVKANGSAAQKLVAEAFQMGTIDDNGNFIGSGKYDEEGAGAMNDYIFALDGNELRAYNNRTGCNVTIKASSQEELKNYAHLVRESEHLNGGNITYDLNTKTATYDGVSGCSVDVCDFDDKGKMNYNIKNSSLKTIDAYGFTGSLNIKNTKDVGVIWDSATKILVSEDPNKRPILNIDDASEVSIAETDL